MSEAQPEKPADAWGQDISEERQLKLQGYLDRWATETDHSGRKGPFDGRPERFGVELTGADVFWLAKQLGAIAEEESDLHLEEADLRLAHLEGADLHGAHLEGVNLVSAHLEEAFLWGTHLEAASLNDAHLEKASLHGARLEGAYLHGAHLESADLGDAHLEAALLYSAHLEGAHLNLAFLDSSTALNNVVLGDERFGYVQVADVRWGSANLAVVDWTRMQRRFFRNRIEAIKLGNVLEARNSKDEKGKPKDRQRRLDDFKNSVRASRQLAAALRAQGLNDDADRFAYQSQVLQREVLRRQGRLSAAFGSWILFLLAGYGYRPGRAILWYLFTIAAFATAYYIVGQPSGIIPGPIDAAVFSVASFHGRGFFPGERSRALAAHRACGARSNDRPAHRDQLHRHLHPALLQLAMTRRRPRTPRLRGVEVSYAAV